MKILSDLIHRSNEDNGIFQINKVIEIQIWHISDFHHSVLLVILKYIIFTELKDQDPEWHRMSFLFLKLDLVT